MSRAMTVTSRLDAIEARANAATEGPWGHLFEPSDSARWVDSPHRLSVATVPAEGDATFIAAARTDVPALVAALQGVLAACDVAERRAESNLARDFFGNRFPVVVEAATIRLAITAALTEVEA